MTIMEKILGRIIYGEFHNIAVPALTDTMMCGCVPGLNIELLSERQMEIIAIDVFRWKHFDMFPSITFKYVKRTMDILEETGAYSGGHEPVPFHHAVHDAHDVYRTLSDEERDKRRLSYQLRYRNR